MATKQTGETQKHWNLISLSFGFLLIWTMVMSGILLSGSVNDNNLAEITLNQFNLQQGISSILFSLGHEMVSTVDWLLIPKASKKFNRQSNGISITWRVTDTVINQVKDRSVYSWNLDASTLLDPMTALLDKFRRNTLVKETNPLDAIRFYADLCDFINKSPKVSRHLTYDAYSHFAAAYNLFNIGMSQRFSEIAFGTIYVRTAIPMNQTEFFNLHFTSKTLIDSSFKQNTRSQTRYLELLEKDPEEFEVLSLIGKDILAGSLNRGTNRLAATYIDSVKEEIATLLLAKDILNSTLGTEIKHLVENTHNTLSFHMSITVVAVIAVFMCLVQMCFSYRIVNSVPQPYQTEARKFHKSQDSVYSLGSNDKAFFLSSNSFYKPFCHL